MAGRFIGEHSGRCGRIARRRRDGKEARSVGQGSYVEFAWRIIGLLGILVMGLSCTGCAQQLDALTSERLRNDPLHLMFGSDDPIFILRNVEDSDARLRAMQDLKEPKLDPKTAPVQDEIVQILAVTANSDNHAVCRLAAVEALARFDDPRRSDTRGRLS